MNILPQVGCSQDSDGQCVEPSCLYHAFAKKGWTRRSLRFLTMWYSIIYVPIKKSALNSAKKMLSFNLMKRGFSNLGKIRIFSCPYNYLLLQPTALKSLLLSKKIVQKINFTKLIFSVVDFCVFSLVLFLLLCVVFVFWNNNFILLLVAPQKRFYELSIK